MRLLIGFIFCLFASLAQAQTFTNLGVNNNSGASNITLTGVTVTAPAVVVFAVLETGGGSSQTCGASSMGDGTNLYGIAASTYVNGSESAGVVCFYYFYYASSGLSGATLNYDYYAPGDTAVISALSIKGSSITGAIDSAVTATNNGSSGSPTVTSGHPAHSDAIVAITGYQQISGGSYTQSSGFSVPPNPETTGGAVSEIIGGGSQSTTSSATVTYSPTISPAGNWGTLIIGFNNGGIAPSGATPFIFTPAVIP